MASPRGLESRLLCACAHYKVSQLWLSFNMSIQLPVPTVQGAPGLQLPSRVPQPPKPAQHLEASSGSGSYITDTVVPLMCLVSVTVKRIVQ